MYRRQLFTYLLRLTGNWTVSEDLFQETLIRVWKNIGKYQEQNKFASWLFSIAHNIAIDHLRTKKHQKEYVLNIDESHSALAAPDHVTNFETREIIKIIEAEIERLPERQKNVFLLRQHSGMSFKEIAQLTNQPLNTVLSHMHYAVGRLRAVLKEKK